MFTVSPHTKLYLIYGHFLHPKYATFFNVKSSWMYLASYLGSQWVGVGAYQEPVYEARMTEESSVTFCLRHRLKIINTQ